MRDWCSSEKYRFATRLYDNNKFPEAILPSESPWEAVDQHTMANNTQGGGIVPHSSNKLWDDRQKNIIQATSLSFSGNLWLPCKNSNLSKFPSSSDSTVLHNGVTTMQDSGTVHAKGWLPHKVTNNLHNFTQFPNATNRSVWGNNAPIISSSPMRDSFYSESTSVRDENIWLSGENSSVSQKSTPFSSPAERQDLSNSYSSIIRDAYRLDRDTLQSFTKANILPNGTQSPSLNNTKILDKATNSRREMRDAGATNTNTWLYFRGESFVQSFTHSPNPTVNKNMNSCVDMTRDSSAMRNTNLKGDAGGIIGITWSPGDSAVLFQNCPQLTTPNEYEAFSNGNSVMEDSSFMHDRDAHVMNGNSWLPDENSILSQKCITFLNSTQSKAFHTDTNIMPDNDVMGDASGINDANLKNESNCLPRANAGLSEICIDYQEPSEMYCAGVLSNAGLMCDAQPSFPNQNDSFSLTNEVDQIVPERNREEGKVPWMNLPATKTSDISDDTLNPLCVPREVQMQDVNDHGVSFLHDLMAIINEEENLWC